MSDRPELSRPYAVERLLSAEAPVPFALAAGPEERAALARRFDLLALDRLEAEGSIARAPGGGGEDRLELRGTLRAEVSQRCVVTLEPVPAEIEAPIERLFAREAGPEAAEVELDPEVEEPEPLEGPTLDVGEVVAEELAMALDPYPRAAGADAAMAEVAARQAAEDAAGPLADLARLRRH